MNIALVQTNTVLGDIKGNTQTCLKAFQKAKDAGVDLVVFPELMLTGYPPQDLLLWDTIFQEVHSALEELAAQTSNQIAMVVGAPVKNQGQGKPCFNAAFLLGNGKILDAVHKSLLPTYDVFDEDRYFEPSQKTPQLFQWKGERFALAICEDSWHMPPNPSLYHRDVLLEAGADQADFILNITASPFHSKQKSLRHQMACFQAKRFKTPFIYLNHVGAHTELIFDGSSFVLDASGNPCLQLASFQQDFLTFNTAELPEPCNAPSPHVLEDMYQALCLGIRDYFEKNGFSKAILGLSGGVDSALTAVLAADALGSENVRAYLLPSPYSSDHSIADALELAKWNGIQAHTLPINSSVEAISQSLRPVLGQMPQGLTEENIQSRIRGLLLMAISNDSGAVLLNTSNKSEAAVGYGTLYGDMCGGLAIIADLYKTQVYALCHYLNQNKARIPEHILTKEPSAELRPDQKDSDSLPPYPLLDQLLFELIENQKSPQQLIEEGMDSEHVQRIFRLLKNAEYKRHQSPPVLRVSSKSFGPGRRFPITSKPPMP